MRCAGVIRACQADAREAVTEVIRRAQVWAKLIHQARGTKRVCGRCLCVARGRGCHAELGAAPVVHRWSSYNAGEPGIGGPYVKDDPRRRSCARAMAENAQPRRPAVAELCSRNGGECATEKTRGGGVVLAQRRRMRSREDPRRRSCARATAENAQPRRPAAAELCSRNGGECAAEKTRCGGVVLAQRRRMRSREDPRRSCARATAEWDRQSWCARAATDCKNDSTLNKNPL
ncbi:hypothetical protein HanRHA438_Chr09g0397471 [Helianthus annuus]|nr:hypothetical protein HanRHA438_Chr09g0397471 [Helianthus annuus]